MESPREFFERYRTDWTATRDGGRVARFYGEPCLTLRAGGSFHVLSTNEEVAKFFQQVIDTYLELTGLRPSPTSHAVVGFRISRRLTQGPAVSTADHYHSLRLGLLTMTRSAYLQVRCAVVALWSEHQAPYAL
jgi:hypothetical protein